MHVTLSGLGATAGNGLFTKMVFAPGAKLTKVEGDVFKVTHEDGFATATASLIFSDPGPQTHIMFTDDGNTAVRGVQVNPT